MRPQNWYELRPLTPVRRQGVVTDSARAAIARVGPRPHRGGAPAGPRPPRLRGLRRAAGDGDPARRLPARLTLPRARARRAAGRLAGHAARGDRGAAEAGMVRTTRGRGGGTVVTYEPRTPSAPPPPGLARRAGGAARLPGVPPRRRAGAAALAVEAQLADVPSAPAHHGARRGPTPHPAAHRQADSRLHLAMAASPARRNDGRRDRGAGRPARHAPGHPRARGQHRALRPPARAIVGAILRGEPTGPARAMEQHCDDTAALLRGLLG